MKTQQCTKCNIVKPLIDYYKNSRRKNRHSSQCKSCANISTANSRAKNPELYTDKRELYRTQRREIFIKWKSSLGCCVCNEKESICLDLHHINSSQKEINLSKAIGGSWENIIKEVQKCRVVCKNCHAKIHAGLLQLPESKGENTDLLEEFILQNNSLNTNNK